MIKVYKIIILIPVLFLVPAFLSAQEVLFPLGNNRVIEEYVQKNSSVKTKPSVSIATILSLPFSDDFSKPGIYPDPFLWVDSNAFINSTFPFLPISIGVATLDGINNRGVPYDSLSGTTRICDYLTSVQIDLNFPVSDSVYLSFFYQPQGLGDEPESGDSLVLEFLNINGDWDHIWSVEGKPNTSFEEEFIKITDPDYLYSGFQFRFLNYATPNGNRDHWHLDYVRLDRNRIYGDGIQDITMIHPQQSWLKDYQSMPWSHYKSLANPLTAMIDTVTDTIFNINYSLTTVNHAPRCVDESGNIILTQPITSQNISTASSVVFTKSLNGFFFPVSPAESAAFLIKNYITSSGTINSYNDTAFYVQRFKNYYSHDDGTAELAYGIAETGAKGAYKFENLKDDTLLGLQIYFNPVGDQVHSKLFQMCYWQSIGYNGGTENVVYKMINLKPANIDSINGFVTYYFDTALAVPKGDFYVGWIQNDATLLGFGIDKNTNSNNNMFYYASGSWHKSSIQGSWMIRPVFGERIILGMDDLLFSNSRINVFPNPSKDIINIEIDKKKSENFSFEIIDLYGRIVLNGKLQDSKVDVSLLTNGLYILRLNEDRSVRTSFTKFLIFK